MGNEVCCANDRVKRNERIRSGPRPKFDSASKAGIRIIHITDVYTIVNYPKLKSLIEAKRDEFPGTTITLLTGDFLAPSLLSSMDRGVGVMNCLNALPVDCLIWGNHEDDLDHQAVCSRTRDFNGTWINTNMQTHETFAETQVDVGLVEASSADGKNNRKIGFIGLLSADETLYRKNRFGGAKIECPYETAQKYKAELKDEVDLVIPLNHLYVPEDVKMCEQLDVPLILSGHDHHIVNEVHHGTRLVKPGSDAKHAFVVDLLWENESTKAPEIDVNGEQVLSWPADEELQAVVDQAQKVLEHLKNSQLCSIPERFRPLSSDGARKQLCSAATFLCTTIKAAMNRDAEHDHEDHHVDAVITSGGNIRGGKVYGDAAFFSMEDLKSELEEDFEMIVLELPGSVIAKMVGETQHEPNPGYFQYDEDVYQDGLAGPVIRINDKALEHFHRYRVAMSRWDCKSGTSPTLVTYVKEHPTMMPPEDAGVQIPALLLHYLAANVWREIFSAIDLDGDGILEDNEIAQIDLDGDGSISRAELGAVMAKLGLSVDLAEDEFINAVMTRGGDKDGDGYLTMDELRKTLQEEEDAPIVASLSMQKGQGFFRKVTTDRRPSEVDNPHVESL